MCKNSPHSEAVCFLFQSAPSCCLLPPLLDFTCRGEWGLTPQKCNPGAQRVDQPFAPVQHDRIRAYQLQEQRSSRAYLWASRKEVPANKRLKNAGFAAALASDDCHLR